MPIISSRESRNGGGSIYLFSKALSTDYSNVIKKSISHLKKIYNYGKILLGEGV